MTTEDPQGSGVTDLRGAARDKAAAPKDVARTMLSDHIPLSLLMDMSSKAGPDSEALLVAEGTVAEEWWQPNTPGE